MISVFAQSDSTRNVPRTTTTKSLVSGPEPTLALVGMPIRPVVPISLVEVEGEIGCPFGH